jgi:hypothetical protein
MVKNEQTSIAVIQRDIKYILERIDGMDKNVSEGFAEINTKVDDKYVTKIEFEPIKKIVYGLVGIILTSVLLAVVGIAIVK